MQICLIWALCSIFVLVFCKSRQDFQTWVLFIWVVNVTIKNINHQRSSGHSEFALLFWSVISDILNKFREASNSDFIKPSIDFLICSQHLSGEQCYVCVMEQSWAHQLQYVGCHSQRWLSQELNITTVNKSGDYNWLTSPLLSHLQSKCLLKCCFNQPITSLTEF